MVNELLSNINNFTDDDLRTINAAIVDQIKFRHDRNALDIKRTLKVGDLVSWNGGARRGPQEGKVIKIKRKKAICAASSGNWDVPLNLLSVISDNDEATTCTNTVRS